MDRHGQFEILIYQRTWAKDRTVEKCKDTAREREIYERDENLILHLDSKYHIALDIRHYSHIYQILLSLPRPLAQHYHHHAVQDFSRVRRIGRPHRKRKR
jgi:hypothetical protein